MVVYIIKVTSIPIPLFLLSSVRIINYNMIYYFLKKKPGNVHSIFTDFSSRAPAALSVQAGGRNKTFGFVIHFCRYFLYNPYKYIPMNNRDIEHAVGAHRIYTYHTRS